jgi:hypothetical protein
MLIMMVVAVLAAVGLSLLVPAMAEAISGDQQRSTTRELQAVHAAIVGDKATGFGFYGDVGSFPRSIGHLVANDTGTPYAGWRGPYLDAPASAIVSAQRRPPSGDHQPRP